jgi:hypothetical protein
VKKIVLGACLLLLLLLAALLALPPWIINQRVVKDRVEAALTHTLGGPVTYERAGLSIFPHLHVSITNPRFSLHDRLSGTARSIDLDAAWRPLRTGTIQFTAVRIEHPDIALILPAGERPGNNLVLKVPAVSLLVTNGRLTVTQNHQRLAALQDLDLRIDALQTTTQSGQNGASPAEPFHITGSARGAIADVALPGPVNFTIAHFDALPQTLSFSDARVQLLDTPFTASGKLDDYLTMISSADLTLQGTIGPEAVRWIRTLTALPPQMTLQPPVTLSHSRLMWHRDGTLELQGTASLQNKVVVSFDLSRTPDRLSVQSLNIRDSESKADLAFTLGKKSLILSFSGHLTQTTLDNIFQSERFRFGWIRGDLNTRIALNHPSDSTVRGTLEGERLVPPLTLNAPVIIDRVSLKATGRTVTVNPLVVSLGGKSHTIRGSVTASADGWRLFLKTDGLEWEPLQALFAPAMNANSTTPGPPGELTTPVRVTLKLDAAYFTAHGWMARPARADIAFTPNGTNIRIQEAGVCGILLSGTATVLPAELDLIFKTKANRQSLASTLTCLSIRDLPVTGTYDLSGTFTSRGEARAWLEHLRGTASFRAAVDIKNQQSTTHHTIAGDTALTASRIGINLKSDGLEWESLHTLFESVRKTGETQVQFRPITLRVNSDSFSAAGWTAQPARAEITITPDGTRIRIDEAGVCAIHLSGTATVQPAHLELHFRTTASRLPLAPTLDCLSGRKLRITGTYDLSGAFTSSGETSQWLDNLRGSVSLTARDGRVYSDLSFTRALEYLNTTNLVKGKFPDPEREGVAYDSIVLKGAMARRVLGISQFIVVSPVADVTGRGSINLADQTMDSVYLIAPFPKADSVMKNIPILGDILGKSLVTIPVRVRGPYKDPTVTPLPPGQVADEIANMMDRILTLPFKIISPLIP